MKSTRQTAVALIVILFHLVCVSQAAATLFDYTPKKKLTPAGEAYDRGAKALLKNDLHGAETYFVESLEMEEDFYAPLLGLAEIAFQKKHNEEAERYLEKALKKAPQIPEVYLAMARFHFSNNNLQGAETFLQKALEVDPSFSVAYIELGTLYAIGLNSPEKAIKPLEQAVALNPKHAGAYYSLGTSLAKVGNLVDAKTCLLKSSELDPDNPLPKQAIGRIYLSQGKLMESLSLFTEIIKKHPQFYDAHFARGEAYLDLGRFDEAVRDFYTVTDAFPDLALPFVKLGMACQGKGDLEKAQNAYMQSLAINPDLSIPYNNLAWIAAETNHDFATALKWARKAVSLAPDMIQYQDTLGYMYHKSGQLKNALDTLENAAASSRPDPVVNYHLGLVYVDLGEKDKAISALEKALRLSPDAIWSQKAQEQVSLLRSGR